MNLETSNHIHCTFTLGSVFQSRSFLLQPSIHHQKTVLRVTLLGGGSRFANRLRRSFPSSSLTLPPTVFVLPIYTSRLRRITKHQPLTRYHHHSTTPLQTTSQCLKPQHPAPRPRTRRSQRARRRVRATIHLSRRRKRRRVCTNHPKRPYYYITLYNTLLKGLR